MKDSHIQWCDHTFNAWMGCTKVSPGCLHCYAEALSKRTGRGEYKRGVPRVRTSAQYWKGPVKWNRGIGCGDCDPCVAGQRCSLVYHPRVFCASLSDWLDDEVPIEWLADLLALIHATPNLDWLLLTKRPENWSARLHQALRETTLGLGFEAWLSTWLDGIPPENVWTGTTVEDQKRADERIPALLAIPAKVRFLSCEPLLEAVDITRWLYGRETPCASCPRDIDCECGFLPRSAFEGEPSLHWVICGGESGGKARPMDEAWARSLRDQCAAAGTAFFMKQLGGVRDARGDLSQIPEDLRVREFPR